jgi:exonuclease SbcD
VKVLHSGDFHLGLTRFGRATPEGNSRVLDFSRTLEHFVDVAIAEHVDLAMIAGDTFHTRHPGPGEINTLVKAVTRGAYCGVSFAFVPGNHDGMAAIGDPETHTLAWMRHADMAGVHVFTMPGWYDISTLSGKEVHIAALPYPHRRALDTMAPGTPDDRVEEVSRRVEAYIEQLGSIEMTADPHPRIFIGHLSVAASKLGSEQTMRIGWDVTVRADVFDQFDYVALGHIHRAQAIPSVSTVVYAGSPDYHLFEDAGQTKAFVLAEVKRGERAVLSRIDSKARPMQVITLKQEFDGAFRRHDDDRGGGEGVEPGTLLKVILDCEVARPTQAAMQSIRETYKHCAYVQIETVLRLPDVRARAAVTAEDRPEAALATWLEAQEDVPMEPTLTVGKELIAEAMTEAA